MISVIIPTVAGREQLLEETCEAFRAAGEKVEFVIVRNETTCGEGWNAGAAQASGEYLLFGADDLRPDPSWAEAAVEAADAGAYPSPWIVHSDGSTLCCGTLGQGLYTSPGKDGLPVYNSPIPFMRRESWELIGPSLPIHYHADDYLAYRARFTARLSVEVRQAYRFTHLDGTVGRMRNVQLGEQHRWVYAKAVSQL